MTVQGPLYRHLNHSSTPPQFIPDGYASHLAQLEYNQRSRPAKSASARMVLRKGSFGLGANSDFLRKRSRPGREMECANFLLSM